MCCLFYYTFIGAKKIKTKFKTSAPLLEAAALHYKERCLAFSRTAAAYLPRTVFKRAFYKKSLKYHPDRHGHQKKSEATERFQVLSAAFRILNDKESRAIYDETVTSEAIADYAAKYHGSKEERDDLIELYNKHKGDMDAIMDSMILAEATDEDRIRKLIEDLLAEKVLEPLDAFVNEPPKKRANRLRRALKEANDCAKEKKRASKKDASADSLVLALQANQKRRLAESENLLDRLTDKYCKPQTKRKASKK
ncbi:DnaJ sub C member 9 [Sparganum proliferum]